MTTKVRYTGSESPYFAPPSTGVMEAWRPGVMADVSDSQAAALVALDVFEIHSPAPVMFGDAAGTTIALPDASTVELANYSRSLPTYGVLLSAPTVAGRLAAPTNSGVDEDVYRVAPNGRKLKGVKLTAAAGTSTRLAYNLSDANTCASELVGFLIYIPAVIAAGTSTSVTFYLEDTGAANSFSYNLGFNLPGWYFVCPHRVSSGLTGKWSVAGGTPAFGTTSFARVQVRMDYTAGQTPSLEFYGVYSIATTNRRVSQVSFGFDDGYASAYTLAAPTVEKYGGRMSAAIIADLIGSSANYMTLDNLKDLLTRGHEVFVHGPLGGTGSLRNYADGNTAGVTADVAYHRAYLVAHDLQSYGSQNVYTFPQELYFWLTGDASAMTNAVKAAGIIGARGQKGSVDPMPSPVGQDCFGPVLVTAGYDTGDTIATIVARINEAAATGRDVFVYFHKVVSSGATGGLEINSSDFVTLCSTVAANVRAGTQAWGSASDMIHRHAGVRVGRAV